MKSSAAVFEPAIAYKVAQKSKPLLGIIVKSY